MSGASGLPRLTTPRGGEPHRVALSVADVRRLEAELMAQLPPGTLMARAATALDVHCARVLRAETGGVAGRSVVLLVGAGDNGGDALYAGARLARRGASVTALLLAERHHVEGAAALRAAGGALRQVDPSGAGVSSAAHGLSGHDLSSPRPSPYRVELDLLADADLVVDGILGIGGRGGLRGAAAILALESRSGAPTVAVDIPSGVDADTGIVEGAAVRAGWTVAMGALKPGLVVGDGRRYAGEVAVVDIGLAVHEVTPVLRVMDDLGAAPGGPLPWDDKYSRGVVGISAGSARYPGAAVLAAGAGRHGSAGLVRYSGSAAAQVVAHWPDVVASEATVADVGRVQCWVVGPGRGTDDEAAQAVLDALASDAPVVLDADALTVVADRAEVRAAIRDRAWPTVLTPHAGEFVRLGGADVTDRIDGSSTTDRVAAVRSLAADLGAVVLLKGATTLVAPGADGPVHAVLTGPPELATAGSGDVLSGLVGAALAHLAAGMRLADDADGTEAARAGSTSSGDDHAGFVLAAVARTVAGAAHLHGVAGQVAARGQRPVAALDVLAAVPDAVCLIRAGADDPAADDPATGG